VAAGLDLGSWDWGAPLPGAPHFTLAELIRSDTAAAYGLDNRPDKASLKRLLKLTRLILEPLRLRFGPIKVLSGFRSPELNWYVSLSRTSRHCRGEAADIVPLDRAVGLMDIITYAHGHLSFQELILEHPPRGWVHVSIGSQGEAARHLMLQEKGRPLCTVALADLQKTYFKA